MNLKIAYIELWDPKIHGHSKTNPEGHFISVNKNLSLEEFYKLSKNEFNFNNNNRSIKLEIVKQYKKNEYVLSLILTYRLKMFQRLWRKNIYKINYWED